MDLLNPAVLFTAIGVLVAWLSWRPLEKWRLRHIPGPSGLPFIGNLHQILQEDLPVFLCRLGKKHGPIFKIWFGNFPFVIVNDPDLVRKILFKFTWRGHFLAINTTSTGIAHELDYSHILGAKGDVWRLGRKAAEGSLINSSSLAGHVPVMEKCVLKMRDLLLQSAARNEPVDMFATLGKMTLAVMGECAFGVDFRTLDGPADEQHAGQSESARAAKQAADALVRCQRVRCSRLIVDMTRADAAPIFLPFQMMFPDYLPLIKWMATYFPTPAQKKAMAAYNLLINTTKDLINTWQQQHKAAAQGASSDSPAKPHAGSEGSGGPAPASASFLSLLLEERRKANNEVDKLTDLQVIANAFIAILAGYETTSSLLAYAVYAMVTHTEVEARMVEEVDAWTKQGRDMSIEELNKFPYIEAVLRESLRMYSPTTGQIREVGEEINLAGYNIPVGTLLMTNTYGFEKDPAWWPQPELFLPQRFMPGGEALGPRNANAYLPFGAGARMCPGHRFAIVEAKLALVRLLQGLSFKLHERTALPLRTKTGITHAPSEGVWVTVQARS